MMFYIVLQELFINAYGNMKATRNWRVIYLTSRRSDPSLPWVVMLILLEHKY